MPSARGNIKLKDNYNIKEILSKKKYKVIMCVVNTGDELDYKIYGVCLRTQSSLSPK